MLKPYAKLITHEELMKAIAEAHPNIALIKYWGKKDSELNLPAAGSLSVTLGPMRTRTSVEWTDTAGDHVLINGEAAAGRDLSRVADFLDIVRAIEPGLGLDKRGARVISDNDFPTAAGLASSASGFAALALAATHAAGLELEPAALSALARQGSGSAARSLDGGFVRMFEGSMDNPEEAAAKQLFDEEHWKLEALLVLTTEGRKAVSSTVGMNQTQRTSPFFKPWIDAVNDALPLAEDAIKARNFTALAELAEASALQMHASAIAAAPGVLYWNGTTVDLIHEVRSLRKEQGLPVFFTIDAGPHVKLFTTPEHIDAVATHVAQLPGVRGTIRAQVGGDARVHLVAPPANT